MISRIVAIAFLEQAVSQCPSGGQAQSSISQRLLALAKLVTRLTFWLIVGTISFFALYYALASPPMHLVYDAAPPAGPSTIYIPGGGFSGFWFHLGFLQSIENLEEYDYYCFSSGCLGVLAVLMNLTLDETADAAFQAQEMWQAGNISRFELVDHFFETLLSQDDPVAVDNLERILPNLKILVTSQRDGHQVREARNRTELKDLLIKTTWVPYLTGWGFMSDEDDVYYDGGFSRLLHPECSHRLDLPLIWETLIHTFSPGLTRDQVGELWSAGHQYDYSIPKRLKNIPSQSSQAF